MTTQKIEEIAKEVETEMQMGGLSDGLYMDFAKEVAIRYASQREEELWKEFEAEKLRHKMELDAVACKTIDNFVIWADNRKSNNKNI